MHPNRNFLFLLIFLVLGCGLFNQEKEPEIIIDDPVYASVYFKDQLEASGFRQGIIAIERNNPSKNKLLTSGKSDYSQLSLSPDGSKLVYSDDYAANSTTVQLGLFDLETGEEELLYSKNGYPILSSRAVSVVWNNEGTGFYFSSRSHEWAGSYSLFYYDIQKQETSVINGEGGGSLLVRGRMGSDTLIVGSSKPGYKGDYLMSENGEFLQKLDNPFLESRTVDNIIERAVWELAWNDSLQLFAGTYKHGEEFDKNKIIVTDLEGKVFKTFTGGGYANGTPAWTKDGNIIYTERRDRKETRLAELKIIDLETGEIKRFFSHNEYPDIRALDSAARIHQ